MTKHKLINAAAVRRLALESRSAQVRGFTRVSARFLMHIENELHRIVLREVHAHPSMGKTLRSPLEGPDPTD